MEHLYSTTDFAERKKTQYLEGKERGVIQALKKQGFSNRAIVCTIHCSLSIVGYGLRRETPVCDADWAAPQGVARTFTRRTAAAAAVPKLYHRIRRSSVGWWDRCMATSDLSIATSDAHG